MFENAKIGKVKRGYGGGERRFYLSEGKGFLLNRGLRSPTTKKSFKEVNISRIFSKSGIARIPISKPQFLFLQNGDSNSIDHQ